MFVPVFLMRHAHAASVRRVQADTPAGILCSAIVATRGLALFVAVKNQAFQLLSHSCLHLSFSSNANTVISRRFFVRTFSRFGFTSCPHFSGSFLHGLPHVLKCSQSWQHIRRPSTGQVSIAHFIICSPRVFQFRPKVRLHSPIHPTQARYLSQTVQPLVSLP